MAFTGRHGVSEAERLVARRFSVDLELETDLEQAGRTDDIADTFDYTHAHAIARRVIEGEPVHLLETLAARIADGLLTQYPTLAAVGVRVGKQPPLDGEVRSAAVQIRRTRTAP